MPTLTKSQELLEKENFQESRTFLSEEMEFLLKKINIPTEIPLKWAEFKLIRDIISFLSYLSLWEELEKEKNRKIEDIFQRYKCVNPEEIRNFLLENDYLIDILIEASNEIKKVFGEVELLLKFSVDPEEDWENIVIIIKSPYNAERTLELSNQLKKEWFLNKLRDTRGKLSITERMM